MGTFMRWRAKARRYPSEKIPNTFGSRSYSSPVVSVLKGVRNANYNEAAFPDTSKVVSAVALANLASLTIWTPTVGNVIQLIDLYVWPTVAGNFLIQLNGVTILDASMSANTPQDLIKQYPGFFCYPTSSVLSVKNNTGSASDVHASALGTEVLG